jgi:N-terminal domain of anti-restriction factor ArdC
MENKATELNAGIRRTIEQLANETDAARQSELFRNYLKTSAAFWDYSWHNQMLIWTQRPTAKLVAGFNTWQKCARYVRKGEKGIAILAPMFFKDNKQTENGGEVTRTTAQPCRKDTEPGPTNPHAISAWIHLRCVRTVVLTIP